MKLPQIIGLMGAFSSLALASGLNTNTNQSAAYLRNVARYATTEADAPYYNPAGTAFMTDGFHISLNSQGYVAPREFCPLWLFWNHRWRWHPELQGRIPLL